MDKFFDIIIGSYQTHTEISTTVKRLINNPGQLIKFLGHFVLFGIFYILGSGQMTFFVEMNTSMHRLSAIVFTDIVGYTALMGENEEIALKTLAKNKEIHDKCFLKFHSTYHKQIGDGFLAIFDSVLEAVYASGFIQDECKKNKISIRTGIHQGEVIFKDQDVFGDEVNITSRIENAAEKGSIYVSENVKKILENNG